MKKYRVQLFACVLLTVFACSSPDKKSSDGSAEGIAVLGPEVFKENLSTTSEPVLIDVRTPGEVREGIIQGAVNMDIKDSTFADKLKDLDRSKSYFLYCKAGKRSDDAAKRMEEMGFKNVSVLDGGIVEWKAKGFETVKP
jgi:rhodanese-related sulfurtransferase